MELILPAIDYVIIAVVALIILTALYYLGELLVLWLSLVPYIGSWLAGKGQAALSGVATARAWLWKNTLWAFHWVADAVTMGWILLISNSIWATERAAAAVWHIINILMPASAAQVRAYADWLHAWAEKQAADFYAKALAAVAGARAYADWLHYWAEKQAADFYHDTLGRLAGLQTYLLGQISTAVAYAVGMLRGDIAAARAAAHAESVALADQAAIAAELAMDVAAVAGIATVWPGIVTDIDTILGEIPATATDIADLVKAIPRAVPTDLAATIAAVGALDAVLWRYLKECGMPMCRDLGALEQLFSSLLGEAAMAGLLAWLVQAVADPEGAASEAIGVTEGVASGAMRLGRDLLGV